MFMIKVSVIVPIYNVQQFIKHCAQSLLQQSLKEVEFIFVNDASPDNSVEILKSVVKDYPERMGNVKILTHGVNRGLPAARNTGLSVATGEYIFHCDGDDFVEPDMLEILYKEAKELELDIVWCDWFLSFEHNERYMRQPDYYTAHEALVGMLAGAMKFNVWNKLVKRSLYNDNGIKFPEGYSMGEDMTMIMLFANAQRVKYVPRAFYHYVKFNMGAFSQTFSEQHKIALKYNVQRVSEYLLRKYGGDMELYTSFLKLETKFPFLIIDGSRKMYDLWVEWFPEANNYILQNKNISLKNRYLQWVAWKGQYWLVWLHYQLIIKVVYGIIYR